LCLLRAGGSIPRVVRPNFIAVFAENSDGQCVKHTIPQCKAMRLLGGPGGMPPPLEIFEN